VTKIPDDSYVTDLSTAKKFSGIVRIEDWQGNFIKGYHYTNGVVDKYYASSKIAHINTQFGIASQTVQFCEIYDTYTCTNSGSGWDCEYAYSTESCTDEGGGSGDPGSGGGGIIYQNVYRYTGAGSGSGGAWSLSSTEGLLCNTISFATDASNYLVANFNNVSETWYNSVQGNVSVNFPATCISFPNSVSPANASSAFNQAYLYAQRFVNDGLNNGSILPADVASKFANALGYYLNLTYQGSSWNAYSNCSATAPVNTPVFCQPQE
jgi:hypothetical protein